MKERERELERSGQRRGMNELVIWNKTEGGEGRMERDTKKKVTKWEKE